MNARPAATISYDVTLQLVSSNASVGVAAVLRYETADPFAVHVVFRTGTDDGRADVEWSFARSLLTEGLDDAAGLGDVLVWPEESIGRNVLCISLSSPSGMALFEADAEQISVFLKATYAAVPAGVEVDQLDLDAELTELMWRATHE